MANKERGEVEFAIGGETYIARPTWERVAQLEEAVGSIISLYRSLIDKSFDISKVIIAASIAVAGDSPRKMAELRPKIFDEGAIKQAAPLIDYLAGILTRGDVGEDDAGNAETTDGSPASD